MDGKGEGGRQTDRKVESKGRMLMKMLKVPALYSMVPTFSSKF
jgi:hypothetical protein